MKRQDRTDVRLLIALGGLAGGLAEVVWVTLYALASDISAVEVARQVTASLSPAAAAWAIAPALGVAIHMVLALTLAALCAPLLMRFAARREGAAALVLLSLIALTTVWAVNFFVVLPTVNPDFIKLMPYAATLASKMLFGLAMAGVLRWSRAGETPHRR